MFEIMNISTSYLIKGVVDVISDFKSAFKTWGDGQRLEWIKCIHVFPAILPAYSMGNFSYGEDWIEQHYINYLYQYKATDLGFCHELFHVTLF